MVGIVLVIYLTLAFLSRKLPDLRAEHRIEFEHEFDASMEDETDWAAYLARENMLAQELAEVMANDQRPASRVDRYSPDSLTYPGNFGDNWNRSYEMTSPAPRGVAVLLHGLTDSPYSMLSTSEALVAAGYNVVVPRMPGHGFAVGGMLQARWEDWGAAVRIAIRRAMQRAGADQSLLIVGYSNGGLMAIDYALRCGDYEDLACPHGLVLISPAIAVSPLAVVANIHSAISWMPYFEKFRWQSVLPEIDPFKFTSFPNRAAWEINGLLRRTHRELEQPDRVANLPPILTFQSAVDNTVSAQAIVNLLYKRLPPNGSKLVVYSVNSDNTLLQLMRGEPVNPAAYFQSNAPMFFDITVLQNGNAGGETLDTFSLNSGETKAIVEETNYAWPGEVFSLSHIALPFRPDDQVYGNGRYNNENTVAFGALAPRGERGVMQLNPDYFLRIRYNPFIVFQQRTLIEWLDQIPATEPAPED